MKTLKLLIKIIILIIIFFVVINAIPPKKVLKDNPFIIKEGSAPLVAAHRGGKNLNPENTFVAFNYAVYELGIDILELDLVMTKDEKLVSIHNLTINESSDVEVVTGSSEEYYVKDHTYEELQNFNFGYNFVDKFGKTPYRDLVTPNQEDRKEIIKAADLNIVTLDKILDAFFLTDLKFIIEIKDDLETGKKAVDYIYDLLNDNERYPNANFMDRVIIGTFNGVVEDYISSKYPNIMRGGSVKNVTKFVITQMLKVNLFDNSSFAALQIPTSRNAFGINIKLDKKTYIRRAHRRGISVQYWTINDKATMKHLIDLGADVIMTDSPDLLIEVLKELNLR